MEARERDEVVNVHEAKTHLSRLLARVERGEEFVLARGGEPVARLIPYRDETEPRRRPGSAKGKIVIHDDFDDPLPEDIAGAFGMQ
jgi:prevent-host-death family protein